MKRFIFIICFFVLAVSSVGAVSSDLRDNYAPRETMIGKLSNNIIGQITREQVSLVKDGHIQVGFDYDIRKLGNTYYVWLIAPQNPGNYTLIIEDIPATEGGYPQIVDYQKDFIVGGQQVNYSVKPGAVLVECTPC